MFLVTGPLPYKVPSLAIRSPLGVAHSSQPCSLHLVHIKRQSGIASGVSESLMNRNGVEQKKRRSDSEEICRQLWSLCPASEWNHAVGQGSTSCAGTAWALLIFCSFQQHPNALKPSGSYYGLIVKVKRGCLTNTYDHPLHSEEGARKPNSGNPGGRGSTKAAENIHMQMANLITTMGCLLCSSWKPTLNHKNAKIVQQAMWQNRALCIHSQLGVLFCCHQMLPRTLHNRNGISRNNKNLSKHKTMA